MDMSRRHRPDARAFPLRLATLAAIAALAACASVPAPSLAPIDAPSDFVPFAEAPFGTPVWSGAMDRVEASEHRSTFEGVSLFNLGFLIGTSTLERAGYEAWRKSALGSLSATVSAPLHFVSRKASGERDLQSGLVVLPAPELARDLSWVVFLKGTELVRDDVPSNRDCDEYPFILALASLGFAVWAPDYTGMGVADGMHEYCVPDSLAASATLGLEAARRWAASCSTGGQGAWRESGRMYVLGYSEGGLAAMAALKELVERRSAGGGDALPRLKIAGAYPLAAPFNLVSWVPYSAGAPLILSRPEYQTYLVLGWASAYPDSIDPDDVLSAEVLSKAVPLFDGTRPGPELRGLIATALGKAEGTVTDADLFSPGFLRALREDPRSSAYYRMQFDARLDEWAVPPGVPVVYAATPTDQIVRFYNTEHAFVWTRTHSPSSDARLVELASPLHAPAGAEGFLYAIMDISKREAMAPRE
jgi:hypothetical protein